MNNADGPLRNFHPLVAEWFQSRFDAPTPVQSEVWAALGRGEHVLAEAPTGNGKTFAAFLLALSRLYDETYDPRSLSVLYVSPLKALNEDIRRNLFEPIEGIAALAKGRGLPLATLTAETRSGDTSETARRRFLTRPPSILCTTPESLAILLDSPRARPILASIRFVIVDEIHAVAGTKRGAHLMASLGRLVLLAGEFQRVALSATLRPAARIAEWFGARRLVGEAGRGALLVPRAVSLVAPRVAKDIEFLVSWPGPTVPNSGVPAAEIESRYAALVPALLERMEGARTTMIFCDARRRAERLAFLLNEEAARRGVEEPIVWAHHGSLSREIREQVESRLKAGELSGVVATGSLELGIDVGSVDKVVLAGAPPSIAQAFQRAGRSGHGVGRTSRVEILPFHGFELLSAAAVAREARKGTIEEIDPPRNPLDLLSQVLLSLSTEEPRSPDALYDIVLSMSSFLDLPRSLFDGTLDLLRGRWAPSEGGAGVRELEPRVILDAASGMVHAVRGASRLLWTSGGTIPDRGLYSMRLARDGKRIGELDEEFVFERKKGDAFTLGSQSWRIVDIGPEAVTVLPLDRPADFIPFWKGGPLHASRELALGILDLVDRLEACGNESEFRRFLEKECAFSEDAVVELGKFLSAQRKAQGGVPLPTSKRIAIEVMGGKGAEGEAALLVHDFRGGRINEGLAFVIAAAFAEEGAGEVQVHADNEGVLVLVPGRKGDEALVEGLRSILRGVGERSRLEALLRALLESSGIFASAFRENAGRALLLPRGGGRKRQPLWRTRLRATRLFAAVRDKENFPITLETWRTILVDQIDLEGLAAFLSDLAEGSIEIRSFFSDRPSPFASGAAWLREGDLMYRADDIRGDRATVSTDAVTLALDSPRYRPLLDPVLVEAFVRKRKRLLPGWAPENLIELAAWIDERVAVTQGELAELAAYSGLEASLSEDESAGGRLERFRLPGGTCDLVVTAARRKELSDDAAACLSEWLRFEGPVEAGTVEALFGIGREEFEVVAEALVDEGIVVRGLLVRGGGESIVDRQNYEIILRIGRAAARPSIAARPLVSLFRLVARTQGLDGGGEGVGNSPEERLRKLAGFPSPVAALKDSILPARLGPGWLASVDALVGAGGWLWFGTGKESVALSDAWIYELFAKRVEASSIIPADSAPADFWTLRERTSLGSRDFALALWREAWEGKIASDSFSSLVHAAGNGFGRKLVDGRTEGLPSFGAGSRRAGSGMPLSFRHRWRAGPPVEGTWSAIGLPESEGDVLDDEELDRGRIKILLGRYGVLLRPLLERELPSLSWQRLFACMRRMELAGELVSGYFFEDAPAPQFVGPEGLAYLRRDEEPEAFRPLWLSALDPASPCGFPGANKIGLVAPRSATVSICLVEGRVVALTRRSGKTLEFEKGLKEEELRSIIGAWVVSVGRLRLETIDGAPANQSPLAACLLERGFEVDRGSLRRWE